MGNFCPSSPSYDIISGFRKNLLMIDDDVIFHSCIVNICISTVKMNIFLTAGHELPSIFIKQNAATLTKNFISFAENFLTKFFKFLEKASAVS